MQVKVNGLSLLLLCMSLVLTFFLSPYLISQSDLVSAVGSGSDWSHLFALKFYLWLQIISFLSFAIWAGGVCRTYLNAPFLLIVAIFLWHLTFVTGYFLYGDGLFSFTGGVFDIGREKILASIAFTGLCMSCLMTGLIYSYGFQLNFGLKARVWGMSLDSDGRARFSWWIERIGSIGIGISLLILVFYDLLEGRASESVTYMELYTEASQSFIYRLFHATQFLAVFFVLMLWGTRISKRRALIGMACVVGIVFLHFLHGSRSLPFILMVAGLVCFDNFVKRLSAPILGGILFGFSALSWVVSQARGGGLGLNVFTLSEDRGLDFLHFFWESGRTIGTVIMTMHFAAQETYRCGMSFLVNVLDMIPTASSLFREYLPFERPSEWLVARAATLGRGEGFGYSLVAESFFNFGYLGCFVFMGLGCFVGRHYFYYIRNNSRFDYLVAMSTAVILTLHMRNDSASYLRTLLLGFLLLYVAKALAVSRLTWAPFKKST